MKCVGLMSGTSVDGVDVALVDIRPRGTAVHHRLLGFQQIPYRPRFRRQILAACEAGTITELCHLNMLAGEVFAQAVLTALKRWNFKPADIALIGSHGQTVCHRPAPVREPGFQSLRSSLQIGEPAVIAERTGITTIGNFRARDLAAGGEGAPLTPYAHHLIFQSRLRSRLIVNLGGIANVTYLPAGGGLADVRAFDVGPCNMLLDGVIAQGTAGRQQMDRGGRRAQRGMVHPNLVNRFLRHPYLHKSPPKTTGREEFGETYVSDILRLANWNALSLDDVLATCCRFIAQTIAGSRRWLRGPIDEVIAGGGGIRNSAMMKALASVFPGSPVQSMDAVGVDSKAFEAVAFALMAHQTFRGIPTTLPSVTGATHPVVLGSITPGSAGLEFLPSSRK